MGVFAMQPSFNVYHQEQGLLFQFILSEFMLAYHEARQLFLIVEQFKLAVFENKRQTKREYWLNNLKGSITQLTGPEQDVARFLLWNPREGQLAKIKNYCRFFVQTLEREEKEIMALNRSTDKAWNLTLQCLEEVRWLEKAIESEREATIEEEMKLIPHYEHLFQFVQKILVSFDKMAQALIRIIYRFRENENVLLFLLRHSQQIDQLYGVGFLLKLFESLHAKGIVGLSILLKDKYTGRGFKHLIPLIDTKLLELEKSMA
jgi:hypothetical protein